MRAMVFAAGLGTRLRPLTDRLPKPVVPLMNRPLCWFALDHLRRAGVTDVVLNTHHLAERVEEELARAPAIAGLSIAFAHEAQLLGTGGGVKHAVAVQSTAMGRSLGEDEVLIAFNGDVLFAPDLERAVALHRSLGAIATMIVRADPEAARYGAIELDDQARVRRLLGKPESDAALRPFMFTGVHVLSARAVADLPDEGCIVRQGYRRWVDRGEVVAGFVDGSPWRDLGTPREYLAANLQLLRGARPGIDPGIALHPTARIEPDASVEECVLGEGVVVAAGVAIRRCVVWPGTLVRASAQDAILSGEWAVEAG